MSTMSTTPPSAYPYPLPVGPGVGGKPRGRTLQRYKDGGWKPDRPTLAASREVFGHSPRTDRRDPVSLVGRTLSPRFYQETVSSFFGGQRMSYGNARSGSTLGLAHSVPCPLH